MIRIAIKILAIYLLWKLVVAPLFMKVLGSAAAFDRFFTQTFWWMSPRADGW